MSQIERESMEYDVVIVGSGAGGATLARELSRQGKSVALVEKGRPLLAVECKASQGAVDRNLRYWKARFPECDAWQISPSGAKDFVSPEGIRVAHALKLLSELV